MHKEKLSHKTSSNSKIVTSLEWPFVTNLTFITAHINPYPYLTTDVPTVLSKTPKVLIMIRIIPNPQ